MGRQNPALADGAGARIKEILSPRQGGFTLVELVVTMIVVGILAVVALP
ncbi:MAG: prepilin-type N-terminal cleavage/methylation domain-containing protein, partial [Rhodocyclaceae bacterium]|nr:prepilin-type N-terminal cleavage/methylation domain-containing protein [Rhodocyclaceae bacterium]